MEMSDPIIDELWQIKDSMAREHDYDIESLVVYLQTRHGSAGRKVVDLSAPRRAGGQGRPRATPGSNGTTTQV